MNITPSILDQALNELKLDRARIDRAIDGLNAIRELNGVGIDAAIPVSAAPTREVQVAPTPLIPTAVTPKPAKVAKPKRAAADTLRCSNCGADDFSTKAGVSIHTRKCDGIRRNAKERKKAVMDRWLANKAKGKAKKSAVRVARVARVEVDEDDDPEPANHKTASPAPKATIRPRCSACDESFASVRDLGIHQSRVHFGRTSAMGSTLGGI